MKSIALLTLISFSAHANIEAIYGDDNRMDVYAVSNPLFVKLSQSTAAMIPKTNIKSNRSESVITGVALGDMFKLCPEERFRRQPVAANCSGTLVARDLIMTAAHCYDMAKQTCREYVWVFDYKVMSENQSSVTVSNAKIYDCKEVVLKEMNENNGTDYALIRLSRSVSDREFAKLRSKGDISANDPLVLIGHPSGLPTKIAADAYVTKVMADSFNSNVDAFTINSGSGVFNAKTGEVEGILASGQKDYDGKGNCSSPVRYEMSEGKETVSVPTKIRQYLENH